MKHIAEEVVDEEFYLTLYSDVAADGMGASKHYNAYGWKEGRDPSPTFSTLYYKDKYLASVEKPTNPLMHYNRLKKSEKIKTITRSDEDFIVLQKAVIEPYFDKGFYLSRYSIGSYADPVSHYLNIGWKSGYKPTTYFDGDAYISNHKFIRGMGLCPFYHFVSTFALSSEEGQKRIVPSTVASRILHGSETVVDEGRMSLIRNEFDEEYYLSTYSDVRQAGIDPLKHYLEYGWNEGRNPNEIFWSKFYVATYLNDGAVNDDPFYHFLTVGKSRGYKPNPYGRGIWSGTNPPTLEDWQRLSPATDTDNAKVIVVIPVYKGFDETILSIYNCLKYDQNTKFALHVINDAGPDTNLNQYLHKLAELKKFVYSINDNNIGFVASVNYALRLYSGKDIILLNSDAIPYNDWIDRLASHAERRPNIATVTPLSNNATIFSYPRINFNNRLALEVAPEIVDSYTRTCNQGSWNEVPTGVGFCLYMTAAGQKQIGLFDEETFGKGYGEENDYCMRAFNTGYLNIQANDIYVYHSGGASFDTTYKKNISEIENRLHSKHPNYPSLVHAHVVADPARLARRRLDCYRFAQYYAHRAVLLLSHSAGGGIETHLNALAKGMSSEGVPVIVFRFCKNDILKMELFDKNDDSLSSLLVESFALQEEMPLFDDFLRWLNPMLVHVHSFVGLSWAYSCQIMGLLQKMKFPYFYTLHDYSPVCHRNNLVTPNSSFCGMPEVNVCRACLKGDSNRADAPDPQERRKIYTAFLKKAHTVFAPSEDVRLRIGNAIELNNIQVRPHEERLIFRRRRNSYTAKPTLRVAAIGAIGPHKGSYVIHSLAVDAQVRQLPITFEIVGYSNITTMMSDANVKETGRYSDEIEALEMLAINDYDIIFLPSIWPETYCYALSLALAAAVTPAVFDLGAQADRLIQAGEGLIIDHKLIKQPSRLNDFLLSEGRRIAKNHKVSYRVRRYKDYLNEYYGMCQVGNERAREARSSVSAN